jgi:hypothetical protein
MQDGDDESPEQPTTHAHSVNATVPVGLQGSRRLLGDRERPLAVRPSDAVVPAIGDNGTRHLRVAVGTPLERQYDARYRTPHRSFMCRSRNGVQRVRSGRYMRFPDRLSRWAQSPWRSQTSGVSSFSRPDVHRDVVDIGARRDMASQDVSERRGGRDGLPADRREGIGPA